MKVIRALYRDVVDPAEVEPLTYFKKVATTLVDLLFIELM